MPSSPVGRIIAHNEADDELSDYDSPLPSAHSSPHRLGHVHSIIGAQPAVQALSEDVRAARQTVSNAYRAASSLMPSETARRLEALESTGHEDAEMLIDIGGRVHKLETQMSNLMMDNGTIDHILQNFNMLNERMACM